MTLFWSLFCWLVSLPALPMVYVMMKNNCKPKKNIIVGATLPYEAHNDEAVLKLLERYKKEMKWTCWAMLALSVPSLFIKSAGIFTTYYMTWCILLAIVFFIPFARCNSALQKLKAERGWRQTEESAQVVTDLKAAAEEMRWLSAWWFLPPFLACLVPVFLEEDARLMFIMFAALVPVSYLCYRYFYRSRSDVVDENSERTIALTRIRRYNWGKFWLMMSWSTGVFSVALWLVLDHVWLSMAVILIYGLVTCAAAVSIELKVRRLQEQLTADSGQGSYVDEDDHWLWGIFYYNPNDSRSLVNARVGMNGTFNLARRPAQFFMGVCVALLLACQLMGVWMIGMERAPVELEVTDTEIVGTHYGGHWNVALSDVADVQLLTERPALRRVSGTGLDNALTGKFKADGWGSVTVCIDPREGPWLLITTQDGALYLFGSTDPASVTEAASLVGAS